MITICYFLKALHSKLIIVSHLGQCFFFLYIVPTLARR